MTAGDEEIAAVFRAHAARAVAALVRVLGDFERAEDAVQEAFVTACRLWPERGVPERPDGWIVVTARNRALDRIRGERRRDHREATVHRLEALAPEVAPDDLPEATVSRIPDDRLALLFTCCHPALNPDARVAMTLRAVGGLTTAEIARAFLVPEATMAQRLVRARRRIADSAIPFRVPPDDELAERLDAVLAVVYLVFNEGYAAREAEGVIRVDLCEEAIALARLLAGLLPGVPAPHALLALLLLHHARRHARVGAGGRPVLLPDQDRTRWDPDAIAAGLAALQRALDLGGADRYEVQAAIAAVHSTAPDRAGTDWERIVRLYDRLEALGPSPVVALNRAIAVAEARGPAEGLALLDALAGEALRGYHYLPAARADLLVRLDRPGEAAAAYREALTQATNPADHAFLQTRLATLEAGSGGATPPARPHGASRGRPTI